MSLYSTPAWRTLRQQILERDNHLCTKCGTTECLEVHHKIPLRFGGQNTPDNLITLCASCHRIVEHATQKWSNGDRTRKRIIPPTAVIHSVTSRTGKGAHVFVPKDWLGKKVKVSLVEGEG